MLTSVTTETTTIDVIDLYSQINNEDVLQFFTTEKFIQHCQLISNAKFYSKRHDLVMSGAFDKNFKFYIQYTNVCFLDDTEAHCNIDKDLKDAIFKFFDKLEITGSPQDDRFFKNSYTNHVLIPEGIIYFIMEKFDLSYQIANEIFLGTTSWQIKEL